jgi:hypothetical protein
MSAADASIEAVLSARTPAEAMRHWMIERLWIASIAAAVFLAALIGILWLGDWSKATEAARLKALAGIAFGAIGFQLVVAWSFSLGGPVGRWQARWGNRSLTAEDDRAARRAYDGEASI